MTELSMKLSAYLDGELDSAEAEAVETHLEADPAAQTELDGFLQAQVDAQDLFDAQLKHPVSLSLVKQIKETQSPDVVRPARPIWGALAASLVALMLGGIGGYVLKDEVTPTQTAGWLSDIADYHAVYAAQGRHLFEVGAEESDHIETWLGNTIGAAFAIPNLSEFGLTFAGGRLLVANGKPVAQLMYRSEDGSVIALCLQQSVTAHAGQSEFKTSTINGFDFVSWSAGDASYVVIGPEGNSDLGAIATQAALAI